jgi:ubiquinone/menaquinone biosynthesis C-methylase UbiE
MRSYLSSRESSEVAEAVAIPAYLEQIYWWAYVHPQAVRIFEREWLVNLILLGNYSRLRDAALDEIGQSASGRTLQVACVYGDLTLRLSEHIPKGGSLDVVDVLPIQLRNLQRKLPPNARVSLFQRDSTALGFADASYDQALVFFLLHEQPDDVRRSTLAEVFRTVKPGGKIVLIDYHEPVSWHPLRTLVRAVLRRLEPYALDLWRHELTHYLPVGVKLTKAYKETYFGGLYQKVVLIR